ncbi:MAG TPA: YncE family protein [Pseudolabrys sp.]|jgi:DNA-binding beta-propeller fold protein YncE|nr:YncE family protein [Pseudolabrys sp.]
MQLGKLVLLPLGAAALLAATYAKPVSAAPFLIVGNDEKLLWDDQGKPVIHPAGKDTVVIMDLADPENPKTVATLPLKNSVIGPPVNVGIDPTNSIALVADSIAVTDDGGKLKMGPDDKVYVIDMKAKPPKLANTITLGKQPSGLCFNKTGSMALVTNRADKTVSVLSIKGTDVKSTDTIDLGGVATSCSFTSDGKHVLVTKFNEGKVSVLDVDGDKVTYTKLDLPTGPWPYNVVAAPSGIALTSDNGNAGNSDGSVDTASVIDTDAKPMRIIDRVVVGDGPEGLAISPKGDIAVSVILAGSNNKPAYYYHRNGYLSVLSIKGKKVTKTGEVEVGGLPEGAAFTPDGRYLYVGNYLDSDLSILKVSRGKITPLKRVKLPGHPGSVGMSEK